jgi:CRP-like cAMP-binding protein
VRRVFGFLMGLLYSVLMEPTVAAQVAAFFAQYQSRTYREGQILIHAHDNPAYVYHLLAGRVKQYDISYRGDEVVLNTFQPPAFFPMSSAMNGTPNVYFFQAETDVELQQAPVEDVIAFIRAAPDVLYDLLARVYRGTDGLLGRLAHIMADSARNRILYELLIEGRRFGVAHESGVAIPVNEHEVGTRAGLARETVNREMNKLKKDNLVMITKNEIVITDIERLAGLIGREL